jgi:hypothetical protein
MYWRNLNNKLIASIDEPNMVFMGKATYDSTVFRTAEVPSGGKSYVLQNENTYTLNATYVGGDLFSCFGTLAGGPAEYLDATGQFRMRSYTGPGTCAPGFYGNQCYLVDFRVRNEVSVVKYTIYSQNEPLIFIHNINGKSGNVASVAASGVFNPQGLQRWDIIIVANYPLGNTILAEQLEVYCFARVPSIAPTGYGLAMWNSSGQVTHNSNYKPLAIRHIATVNSINFNTYGSESINTTVSDSANFATLAKPGFASVDWFRARLDFESAHFQVFVGRSVPGGCASAVYECWFSASQTGVSSGFFKGTIPTELGVSISLAYVESYTSAGFRRFDFLISDTTPNFDWRNIRTTPFPFNVPIINCADYD